MSLVTDVQEILDESAGAVFWTTPHIYDALNRTLLEIAPEINYQFISANLDIATNNEFVRIPYNIYIPKTILFENKKYFITAHADLERYNREWKKVSTGQPKSFILWDAFHLRMFPKADQDYTYLIQGIPYPTEVGATQQELIIGTNTYVPKLLKRAVAMLSAGRLMWSTIPDQAAEVIEEGLRTLRRFKIQNRNQQGHNIRRFHPGGNRQATMFDQYAGAITLQKQFS